MWRYGISPKRTLRRLRADKGKQPGKRRDFAAFPIRHHGLHIVGNCIDPSSDSIVGFAAPRRKRRLGKVALSVFACAFGIFCSRSSAQTARARAFFRAASLPESPGVRMDGAECAQRQPFQDPVES